MKCQCTLTDSKTMEGKCDHKRGKCTNKSKREFKSQGTVLDLCIACTTQYNTRWRPWLIKKAA